MTNHTCQLTIATVKCPNGSGTTGITLCLGTREVNPLVGQSDLDLEFIEAWGATAVVNLMSDYELSELKVHQFGDQVDSRGMLWFQLPMPDEPLTDEAFELQWTYTDARLTEFLQAGNRVLLNGRTGLAHTGLIAARLPMELGLPWQLAVTTFRQVKLGALQSPMQLAHLEGNQIVHSLTWMDHVRGCLLVAVAVGDAFASLDSMDQIHTRLGEPGLTKPMFHHGSLVASGSAQMTVLTWAGILRCIGPDGAIRAPKIIQAIRAYEKSSDIQPRPLDAKQLNGLANMSAGHMNHTLGSVYSDVPQGTQQGNKDITAKGYGSLMRRAPIGFLHGLDVFNLGLHAAARTDSPPTEWLTSGILPCFMYHLNDGTDKALPLHNGLSDAAEWRRRCGVEVNAACFVLAPELAYKTQLNADKAMPVMGTGWDGDKTPAIAICAGLSGLSYSDAVSRATRYDGDSDSVATVGGQLWGAHHRLSDILNAWIGGLDVLDDVLKLAQQLRGWQRFPLAPRLVQREMLNSGEGCDADTEKGAVQQSAWPQATRLLEPAAEDRRHCLEPSSYDFADINSRTHGLVTLYRLGVPYLFQVTHLIWRLLPAPKEDAAMRLCAGLGLTGKGKCGLHAMLEHYLETTDQACEAAIGDAELKWTDADGSITRTRVQQTFDLMDQAVFACAFQLAQHIERIVNPA